VSDPHLRHENWPQGPSRGRSVLSACVADDVVAPSDACILIDELLGGTPSPICAVTSAAPRAQRTCHLHVWSHRLLRPRCVGMLVPPASFDRPAGVMHSSAALCPSPSLRFPSTWLAAGPATRDGASAQLENYAVLNGEIVGNIIFGGLHVRNCLSEAFYS
jgi:hypothetical protein